MQARKEASGWLLILSKGEDLKGSISEWAKKENVRGAYFWGIGAVKEVELGFFDTAASKYVNRKFEGEYELVSCMGDITEDGVHAHVSMSGADFVCLGGHLQHATISVFGEFFVSLTSPIARVPDSATGLRKIDVGK